MKLTSYATFSGPGTFLGSHQFLFGPPPSPAFLKGKKESTREGVVEKKEQESERLLVLPHGFSRSELGARS